MFSLDYRTFSQTLQTMRYTGLAKATIPSGKWVGGTITLKVYAGVIQSCVVTTREGLHVNDKRQIDHYFARSGLLEWQLAPFSANSTPFEHSPSPHTTREESLPPQEAFPANPTMLSAKSYPFRLSADPKVLKTLPPLHRQVYTLSTGQYSEQDVARLLNCAPDELLRIFRDLEQIGVLLRKG